MVLTPLGGLGEFGMNMMLVECGDDLIVIDAGMMFPDSNMLGVDFVLPDITYLIEKRDNLRAVLLTHGHEDHIGGLAHLLQHVDVPVYGARLTLALASSRLQEYGVLSKADLREIDRTSRLVFGAVECEFLQMSHSIPGVLAISLHTPAGTIVHTADFKFDHEPAGLERPDIGRFAQLGERGVTLLLSDSTNVERPGHTPSERSILPALERIFRSARGRLIVSTFSSSLYRIQQFVDLAVEFNRCIGTTGRNMVNNIKIASELGYLRVPAGVLVDIRDLGDLPPERSMVLTTGSQGEPLSALALMANDSHARLKIAPGDTMVISARIIPGHERDVGRLVNHLYRRGADVYYGPAAGIHVSGHGSQEDLKLMLDLVRPKFFIPIHGEYRQLVRHARLAEDVGMPPSRVLVVEDGQQIRLTRETCEIGETVQAGRVLVDGKLLDNVEEIVLRDRQQLSEDGMVLVVVVMNQQSGEIVAGPDLVSRGFVYVDESEDLIEDAKERVREAVAALNAEERSEQETVQETVRVALRRFFTKRTDRRPLVLPVILEV